MKRVAGRRHGGVGARTLSLTQVVPLLSFHQASKSSLHGKNIIAGRVSAEQSGVTFYSYNPAIAQEVKSTLFHEATSADIDAALNEAAKASSQLHQKSPQEVSTFLNNCASSIESLGDTLVEAVVTETGLGAERIKGEIVRTANQLKMFGSLVAEGSWVDARIDRTPTSDTRRMLLPLSGAVVVFGASNFPIAFGSVGGDTASALAARCPVVVKGHPSHPATSELLATAIQQAAEKSKMPPGIFSLLHGKRNEIGVKLVTHPLTEAVAFTGSLKGGMALHEVATKQRKDPIPVYAEMGSINPIFVLPGAAKERTAQIAEGLKTSVTGSMGQLCTKPGLVFVAGEAAPALIDQINNLIAATPGAPLLNQGIKETFETSVNKLSHIKGVKGAVPPKTGIHPHPVVFHTTGDVFLREREHLMEEVFGPYTLVVRCEGGLKEMEQLAQLLPGQLAGVVHLTEKETAEGESLVRTLQKRVGRVVFNAFPTGVAVCPSMHHGGPFPATTTPHWTSVGTDSIRRFTRPVCFQGAPQSLLPPELQNENSRSIWRLVNNTLTKDSLS